MRINLFQRWNSLLKVLHCEVEIIESETLMDFLADEKVSDNEAIVSFL